MTPELTSLIQAVGLAFTGVISAVAALLYMARNPRGKTRQPGDLTAEIVFLFDGESVTDASDSANRLLNLTEPHGSDFGRLVRFLSPRFPGLRDICLRLNPGDAVSETSSDGQARLLLSHGGNGLRIQLKDIAGDAPGPAPDRYCFGALTDELKMHRALGDGTPFPVWCQSSDGRILWANGEYRILAARLNTAARSDELRPIFSEDLSTKAAARTVLRARLEMPHEAEPKWFEFQVNRLGSDLLVAAIPVDRVVRAERSLNDFVQTLTQTFAHLNVGLAVFNRSRELALFNPALADLLDLSPEFLITRPTLFQLFDRLREKRMLPEPKDYSSWRRRMSALEAAAADGVHSETWSLVDGRTYRVTGRPHPEGAVAFLFEDISAEITLERKFRTDLQIGQAVIDGLEEAIAVFSPSGAMVMLNRAYVALWLDPSDQNPEDQTMIDASRNWQSLCIPTPVWGDARDFAATIGERGDWTADVRLRDGRHLVCRFDALPGGCTLVGFSESAAVAAPQVTLQGKSLSA